MMNTSATMDIVALKTIFVCFSHISLTTITRIIPIYCLSTASKFAWLTSHAIFFNAEILERIACFA